MLNEILAHPSSGNDWIELYNTTTSTMDLTSWTIDDSSSSIKTLSGNLPANGFVYFEVSNRLNNPGDTITLKDSSGNTVDTYSYSTDPGTDISLGRYPDGGGWTSLISSSQNSSNNNSQISSPTPSPSSSTPPSNPTPSPQNIFQISNTPSSINSDKSFAVNVQLKIPALASQRIYLKGAFKKSDSTNYFGLTKHNSNWIKNGESYNEQFSIETNSSGEWNGSTEIMPDVTDSGYSQTNSYDFKMAFYNKDGSGPTWSNQTVININHINNQSSTPTTSPSPAPSPSLSTDLGETILEEGISTISAGIEEYDQQEISLSQNSATVEGISVQNTTENKSKGSSFTPILIIFGFACFGAAVFYYLRIRKNQLQS